MNQFCQALIQTLSPEANVRQAAESYISSLQQAPGFDSTLYQLVTDHAIPEDIRQAAAILLKNLVRKNWEGKAIFGEDFKGFLRGNLVRAMASVPRTVETQLGEVFATILKVDYPDRWPGLMEEILALLASQETPKIRAALYAMQIITKRYEYSSTMLDSGNKRLPLFFIIENTFPVLLKLFQYLVQQNSTEYLSFEMELILIKIFWNSTQFAMAPFFVNNENFHPWVELFIFILNRAVPEKSWIDPSDPATDLPWKQKIWISKIFERYITRYATPRSNDAEVNRAFSNLFMKNYVAELLNVNINFLRKYDGHKKFPSKLTVNLLNYANSCIYYSHTWKTIKPYLDNFLVNIFYPILLFGPNDAKMFEEDPQEFLRIEFDCTQEFLNPRSSVLALMAETVKLRGPQFLQFYMSFFINMMEKYLNTPPPQRDIGEKYTALLVFGHFSYILLESEAFKSNLEEILTKHVFPELLSPIPFLKARALWVFGKFHLLKFAHQEHFQQAFQLVINSLKDSCLPVCIFATITLQSFLENKSVRPLIQKIVPQIIETILNLLNQIDNDDLVGALKSLIEKFGPEIQQLIPEIMLKLVEQYQKLLARGEELFDEDDQAGFLAAIEYLQAILTILENVKGVSGMLPRLEKPLIPLLLSVEPAHVDLFPDYIQIASYFTYYDEISDDMWRVFEKFVEVYYTWGPDFLQELLVPFDNFISRSTNRFLAGPSGATDFQNTYLGRVCGIFQKEMENLDSGETNAAVACSLIEVVLVYCRGRVDPIVPTVMDLALKRLKVARMNLLKVALLGVIGNAIYYNPVIALQFLETQGAASELFNLWLDLLNDSTSFKRRHPLKVTILAFSAIFHAPVSSWPQTLRQYAKNIITTLMSSCNKYTKLKQEHSNRSQESDSSDSLDEGETGNKGKKKAKGEYNEGEDLGLTKDEFQSIEKEIAEYKKKIYHDEEDVAPDLLNGAIMTKLSEMYDDIDTSSIEDEEEFNTLLDDVDELVFFLDSFRSFGGKEPQAYQQILSTFSVEEQQELQKLAEEANSRKKE